MLQGRAARSGRLFTALILLFACGLMRAAAPAAQEPVTTSVDLLDEVRRLKTMAGRIHLEWLYLEGAIDGQPVQTALVKSGREVEFGEGLLYHGRDGLDEALRAGRVEGPSYLTRVPHVWAIGPFHCLSRSPAIFVIEAGDFDRLRDEGKAVLEAEIDRESGIMDPYPKITKGIPLDMVREIWIDQDTADRYDRLCGRPVAELAAPDRALRDAVAGWRAAGKLVVIPGLAHAALSTGDFYPAAFEAVGAYFVGNRLTDRIPVFRPR
jgi:hypothetical protein